MIDTEPFLLVRARPKDESKIPFERWFNDSHLRDIRGIPGITRVRSGVTPAGTTLGLYSFADNEALQAALASPEAAYARGTWEQWSGNLDELLIEIFAPLFPLPIYESMC